MAELALIVEPDRDEPSFACVYVDGTLAGRAYRFVLDTGAARTQLTTGECTDSLPTVGADSSAGAFGGWAGDPLVTVTGLVAGPLRAATLDVTRAADGPNVLGMDVLGQHRCVFRLDAGVVAIDEPDGVEAGLLAGGVRRAGLRPTWAEGPPVRKPSPLWAAGASSCCYP